MDLKRFKDEYDPEFKKKSFINKVKQPINLFKKKENNYDDNIKNNYEDDEININKTDNEKDDGLSL